MPIMPFSSFAYTGQSLGVLLFVFVSLGYVSLIQLITLGYIFWVFQVNIIILIQFVIAVA